MNELIEGGHDERTVQRILAVPRQERLSLKSYYSKDFDITTEWDGGKKYVIHVYDNATKILLDQKSVWDDSFTMALVDEEFETLKTRWILSYSKTSGA